MRIIHTSDWHLGQHFIGKSRLAEHQQFIQWLIEKINLNQIDALIISGDIYDTGSPPSYARELYNQLVIEVNKCGCQLVVLGGNHDSVSTLNESKGLLKHLSAEVVASVDEQLTQQVITLKNRAGEPGAILCAIPYIRPRDVMQSSADQSAKDKAQTLSNAIAEHYQQIFALAEQSRDSLGLDIPIIATGHLTAIGVKTSESVRDIYVGNLEAFPASAFPPADYIALGHIHRPQIVAKSEHIRYCGSPIPLSFDEIGTQKQVLMVEFEQGRLSTITPLLIPRFQPMATIKGDLDAIAKQLAELDTESSKLPVWLSIEVQTQDYLNDLTQRIVQLTEALNVEVLLLRRARKNLNRGLVSEEKETLSELNAYEVFDRRLNDEVFESEAEQARIKRLKERFSAIVTQVEAENDLPSSKPSDDFFLHNRVEEATEEGQLNVGLGEDDPLAEQQQAEIYESEPQVQASLQTEQATDELKKVDAEQLEHQKQTLKPAQEPDLFALEGEPDSVIEPLLVQTPVSKAKADKGKATKRTATKPAVETAIEQDDMFSALAKDSAEEKSL